LFTRVSPPLLTMGQKARKDLVEIILANQERVVL
jgi:hypothetical protein